MSAHSMTIIMLENAHYFLTSPDWISCSLRHNYSYNNELLRAFQYHNYVGTQHSMNGILHEVQQLSNQSDEDASGGSANGNGTPSGSGTLNVFRVMQTLW